MNGYASVVFDLDGTLVDSSHDIAAALNRALAGRANWSLSGADVLPLLGEGVAALVSRAAELSGVGSADLESLAKVYLAEYRAHPVVDSVLFPEVILTLEALAAAGVPMAVCTNKVTGIAEQVLTGLGVRHHFDSVVGADRPARSKPDPEHLRTALADLGADPGTAVLVGDSPIDQRCAEATGVDFLAVAWAPPEVGGTRLPRFSSLLGHVAGTSPTNPAPPNIAPPTPTVAPERSDLQEHR